jgi:hypothetical protein
LLGRITEKRAGTARGHAVAKAQCSRGQRGVEHMDPKINNCGIISVPDFYRFFLNFFLESRQNPVLKSNLGRRKLYGRESPSEKKYRKEIGS